MYILLYDFGTSSVKTCLFAIDSEMRLAASSTAAYGLYFSDDSGAEQDPEEWWAALCSTTRQVGATGTALVAAAGLKGDDVLELSRRLVKVNHVCVPAPRNREVYERNDRVYKKRYKANAKSFQELNA